MARTVPAVYTPPEASRMAPGGFINSADAAELTAATNSLISWGGINSVWSQGWDTPLNYSTNAAFEMACSLRIPQLSAYHTTLAVAVRAEIAVAGTAGKVRFEAVNGASTFDYNIAVGPIAWYTGGTITPAFVGGVETIRLHMQGDGGGTSHEMFVRDVSVYWLPAAGPLAAGMASTGEIPADTSEDADDMPWSARKARSISGNLAVLRTRPRMLISCAGLIHLSKPLGVGVRTFYFPRLPGADQVDDGRYEITFHALMSGAASRTVYNLHQGDIITLDSAGAGLLWAAPQTAPYVNWASTDTPVRIGDIDFHVENNVEPEAWPSTSPWPRDTDSVGNIYSLCAWGR